MAPISCTIRSAAEADLPAIAAIHMASWRDAYRSLIPAEVLLGRSVADCLAGWRSTLAKYPANVTVAAAADRRIYGFCCAGPVVDDARSAPFGFEVYGLHVAPASRQNGIGASLLRRALARAKDEERSNSAIVWTLEDLALSRKFYEREGGKPVKTGIWRLDGIALAEIAYGWTDLAQFTFPLPRG
jgi:ribosomal protein S18 acetylase RimI-like enzyme